MTTLNVALGVVFLVVALVFIIIGAAATAGKLPGNKVIGLRVQEVRANEATWVRAHRVVGPFWILAGVALAMGGAFALIAHGWVWVAPAIAVLAAGAAHAAGAAGTETEAAPPAVDLDAVRKAAGSADERR